MDLTLAKARTRKPAHRTAVVATMAGPAPRAAGPVGVPAVVALEHLALVGNVAHHPRQELQRIQRLRPGRRPTGLVGVIRDRAGVRCVAQAAERHRMARTVAGQPGGERLIVRGDPHAVVHVKARVRPGEYAGGSVAVEQLAFAPSDCSCACAPLLPGGLMRLPCELNADPALPR